MTTYTGLSASRGIIKGKARVLAEPSPIQKGHIPVCKATTVEWMETLYLAGAVVTERGGPLSHAAIIARELGIPAVVGVGGITSIIQDGEIIIVDGAAGMVHTELV